MRRFLYVLGFISVVCAADAAVSHLEIRQPSLAASNLKGPVKRITTEYNYEMSDRTYREIADYDEAGNLISRRKWDYKDNLTLLVTNSYNEAGCHIRHVVDDQKEHEKFDYEVILNPATRQLAYKCRITGEIEIVTYDEHRWRTLSMIKKKGKRNVPLSNYVRGSNHLPRQYTKYDDDGRVKYVSTYKRDSEGRLSASVSKYKQEKKTSRCGYEYLSIDDFGNWTQRLLKIEVNENGEEKKYDKFTTRKIEYYELTEAGE